MSELLGHTFHFYQGFARFGSMLASFGPACAGPLDVGALGSHFPFLFKIPDIGVEILNLQCFDHNSTHNALF